MLKNTLGTNHPFVGVVKQESHKRCIGRLCAARNYAAHNSKQSKEAAKREFNVSTMSSAGSFLKKANHYDDIVTQLVNLANTVKTANLY